MTPEGADKIIDQVGRLITEATGRVEFRSGDRETTKVIAGFPFTLVKSVENQAASTTETEYVTPWFPDLGGANRVYFYSTAADGGSNVFFLPFDPTTTIDGNSCYDVPPPSIFIPAGTYRLIYLEQTFQVTAWEDATYTIVQSVTAGPASIFAVADGTGDIPYSSYPGASQVFKYPGTYTYYFLMARLLGVEGDSAQKTTIPNSIWTEDAIRNYGARQMLTGSQPFSANFATVVYGAGSLGLTAGDNAAEGGYRAQSYAAP